MASDSTVYDTIGRTYSATRREDPRIAAHLHAAIGDATSVVNLGAGTGSYEPDGPTVVAVEPSAAMVEQRRDRTNLVVRAVGQALPFPDHSFDVALAVLTLHHWADLDRGLSEMRRVSRRQVVLYFEPLQTHRFWGLEYFPEAAELAVEVRAPGETELRRALQVREVRRVLVPKDCMDGFGTAFWARPEAYLDPTVQAGMSWLALLPEAVRARGAAHLARDLASGEWERRFGHLRLLDEFDGGYRLAIGGD
jgi:SAM-dependent methyltransferase